MSGALRSAGPRSVRLLLSWLAVYAALVGASPTPVVDADNDNIALSVSDGTLDKRVVGQFPTFTNDYNGRVRKGYFLKMLMPLNDAAAAQLNEGRAVSSPWQDPRWVEYWGWVRNPTVWGPFEDDALDNDPDGAPGFGTILDPAFADPNYPVNPSENGVSKFEHNNEFRLRNSQEMGTPTQAYYKNVFNPRFGAIMFDDNISPRSEIATNGLGDAPELEQLSDIAYFQWLYACREKNIHPANIRLIFRAKITYAPSFELIALALSDAGYGRVPGWDRRATFGMDTRPGLAILGSTHGSGAALFLIQHKRILGLKKITQVTVWGDNGGFALDSDAERVALNLRFVVTNA
ncbi:hypothetical protein CH35J_003069 [Colletotrichum higginsianum]|uniref:WD domain-containing protein n=1 Tax=Colletotrichum higginsianum TaxID=80884 RepID=A0A4T0WGJ8_9PEZI|nr:hypothetical protein CH35J_003069 [Colletotrichum higginsianum]